MGAQEQAPAAPGNWLERQVLGLPPGPTESGSEVVPEFPALTSPPGGSDVHSRLRTAESDRELLDPTYTHKPASSLSLHISPGEGTEVSTLFRGDRGGGIIKESAGQPRGRQQ